MKTTKHRCGCTVVLTDDVADEMRTEGKGVKIVRMAYVDRCPTCQEYVNIRKRMIPMALAMADRTIPRGCGDAWNKRFLDNVDMLYAQEVGNANA